MIRPDLRQYGERLRRASHMFDELSDIAREMGLPQCSPEMAVVDMRRAFGQPLRAEDAEALSRYVNALEGHPRFGDYTFLKEYCNAVATMQSRYLTCLACYFGGEHSLEEHAILSGLSASSREAAR